MIGYGAQGFCKFGFYEVFKDVFKSVAGPENAVKYQTVGFALSSACAEFIADIALAPFEAVSKLALNFWECYPKIFKLNL